MLKLIKTVLSIVLLLTQLEAQNYCEQPVQGVYESGSQIERLFEQAVTVSDQTNIAVTATVEQSLLLEAGKRAGEYYLEMRRDDITSILPLGEFEAKKAPFARDTTQYAESFAQGLGFYFNNNRLIEIKVTNPEYKTAHSIGVAATIEKLKQHFQCSDDPVLKTCPGIGFEMDGNQVKSVHIFSKKD